MTDLGYFYAVDLELSVWVRLLGVDDLLDRDGSEGVFAVLWAMSADLHLSLEMGHVPCCHWEFLDCRLESLV